MKGEEIIQQERETGIGKGEKKKGRRKKYVYTHKIDKIVALLISFTSLKRMICAVVI